MASLAHLGSGCRTCTARATNLRLRSVAPFRANAGRKTMSVRALFGGGQGGAGGFDMGRLMESVKKAQQLVQTETARVQQELANTEFDGYDEEETVRVVVSGNQEPRSVDITQAAMECGAEELSRRTAVAMKEAHGKSVAGMKERMKDLARSLGLPNPGALNL